MPKASDSSQTPSIWLRLPPAARRPRPQLDRDDITRVAIELADQHDLPAVSMRRIARELGVAAPSLYWYVKSKNELYELMADAVIGEVALPERASGDWREDLRSIARAVRSTLRRHSWYSQLGIQPMLGPNTQRYAEQAALPLQALALSPADEVEILAALNNYIVGFVHREHAWHQVIRRSDLTEARWNQMLDELAANTAADDPRLAAAMAKRFTLHSDQSFEFGLACMLDGIADQATSDASKAASNGVRVQRSPTRRKATNS
jgi:AcrR family transcriptional regulator